MKLFTRFNEFCLSVCLVDGCDPNSGLDSCDVCLEEENESTIRLTDERPIGLLINDVNGRGITWFGFATEGFSTSPTGSLVLC